MTNPGDWKNFQVRAAEAELDLAIAHLDTVVAEAEARFAAVPDSTLTDEDIELIERHNRGSEATQAQRELQGRIDAGEFTWRDIVSGRAAGEEGVREALEAGIPQMRQAHALIEEGHSVNEIIAAGLPPEDDPDDFGGPIMRKR
ncbi:hypothetical protein ACOBQX_14620 [Actinokineospora sp. G85]|uniref:hypothetical protein n=1 Tax=Actinokineospora sp. G85 TaxID=3406626 RepID=UPI003C767C76